MKEEKRVKIFLALTSIHRKIKNNEGKTKINSRKAWLLSNEK